MAIWLIRAGKHGQDESAAIEKGLAIVGWEEMPNVSGISSFEEMKKKHAEIYPAMSPKAIINSAAQLWAFMNKIKVDDIAVLPLKTNSKIALGRIKGPYKFLDGRHVRKVEWIREDVPRTDFGQDLLYSFGAFMTVCQIQRNEAEKRIQEMLKGKKDPNLGKGPEADDVENLPVDLEEHAYDQIRALIQAKFKGHNLAVLVEAILNVQGYQTYRSPEGADGGIDILAGYGPMGFDSPRICVQVKSGGVMNDAAIRELEGVMSRMGAEQGLFVSWDGFNKTASQKIKDIFFKVRLWDDKKLMSELLEHYEKLPDDIQADLPLKRIWVVVSEQDS
jgi:restriction system protein